MPVQMVFGEGMCDMAFVKLATKGGPHRLREHAQAIIEPVCCA